MKWTDTGVGDFQQPPTGTHLARCYGLIDIGTQKSEYKGQTVIRRQVILRWELPTELMEDGRPFSVSKFYTQSLNEKSNLYADLVNWRGREFTKDELSGFDAKAILDKTCLLSITMNDKGKARVTGLMKGPKHMEVPPRVNDLVFFSLESDEFDQNTFNALSEGIQKMIRLSPEWADLNSSKPHANGTRDDLDDDIPF